MKIRDQIEEEILKARVQSNDKKELVILLNKADHQAFVAELEPLNVGTWSMADIRRYCGHDIIVSEDVARPEVVIRLY